VSTKYKTSAPPGAEPGLVINPDSTQPAILAGQPNTEAFIDEPTALRRVPVSRRTWFDWRKKGLPYIRVGKRIMFHWPSVADWLLRQQRGG